ncbi:Slp family lipoprotein [Candidatus Nitrospira bockiana]
MSRTGIAILFALCGVTTACAARQVVPPELERQIDRQLTFAQIKEDPEQYLGRTVVLGGEVLSAKRLKSGTRVEVLQLPLDDRQAPVLDRTQSEGRFLAFQREFLDPAKLPGGTRVTITGEITGSTVQPLDETEYTYPTLDLKSLTVWDEDRRLARPYPYYGPYYSPYWGPYWGWRRWGPWGPYPYYPYWW